MEFCGLGGSCRGLPGGVRGVGRCRPMMRPLREAMLGGTIEGAAAAVAVAGDVCRPPSSCSCCCCSCSSCSTMG